MQKATKLRIVQFMTPLLLGIGFIGKALYAVGFAWWLNPLLDRKANRELVDDIRVHFRFLLSDSDSIHILRADWPTVQIPYQNLLFTIVRWHGETAVSIAPHHAPTESYELGPVMATIESRHFSERDIINDLDDAEKLLKPRLDALNAAFSPETYPHTRERI